MTYPGWRAYLEREHEKYRLGLSPIGLRDAYLLVYIRDYVRAKGRPPTLRGLAAKMGWASWHTAWYHRERLSHRGYVTYEPWRERTLALTPKGRAFVEGVL